MIPPRVVGVDVWTEAGGLRWISQVNWVVGWEPSEEGVLGDSRASGSPAWPAHWVTDDRGATRAPGVPVMLMRRPCSRAHGGVLAGSPDPLVPAATWVVKGPHSHTLAVAVTTGQAHQCVLPCLPDQATFSLSAFSRIRWQRLSRWERSV